MPAPKSYRELIERGLPAAEPQKVVVLGGFGLLLARRNVDELHYQRFGGRNRYTLIVYRNQG